MNFYNTHAYDFEDNKAYLGYVTSLGEFDIPVVIVNLITEYISDEFYTPIDDQSYFNFGDMEKTLEYIEQDDQNIHVNLNTLIRMYHETGLPFWFNQTKHILLTDEYEMDNELIIDMQNLVEDSLDLHQILCAPNLKTLRVNLNHIPINIRGIFVDKLTHFHSAVERTMVTEQWSQNIVEISHCGYETVSSYLPSLKLLHLDSVYNIDTMDLDAPCLQKIVLENTPEITSDRINADHFDLFEFYGCD